MQTRKVIHATVLLCLAAASKAQPAPSDTARLPVRDIGEVVVSDRRPSRSVQSSSPLQLFTRREMLQRGILDVADALNRMPGIVLKDYGGAGGLKTVSVRGFGAKHTGVSYDGVVLGEIQGSEIDLSRYSLTDVDYLSVTVGDNNAVFLPARQAASAALVTIQTLSPPTDSAAFHIHASMKAGSFGYLSPYVRLSGNDSRRLSYAVKGEYTYAENDYPYTLRNLTVVTRERRTNSRMKTARAEAGLIWQASPGRQWQGKVYAYDNDRQLPGQVRFYTNINREHLRDRNVFVQLQYTDTGGSRWKWKALAKADRSDTRYRDEAYAGGIMNADYRQREAYVAACLLYLPDDAWSFGYSADYFFNDLKSSLATDTRPSRHSILQSLTARYAAGRLTVTARLLASIYLNQEKSGDGARDMHRLSPSVSLSCRLLAHRELYLRASYKNIFRAPSFNENYFFHYGSKTLLPELTDQFNLGITFGKNFGHTSALRLTLDGYLNHVKDKIVAVPLNMFVWTNINVGRVRTLGIDASVFCRYGLAHRHRLLLATSYSYQRATNRTRKDSPYYGYQLAYTPLHSGSASLTYENPWVNVVLDMIATDMRFGTNEHYPDTGIDGYASFGLSLYRRFTTGRHTFDVRFDLKNIFDKSYEIVRFYPMPGRNFQISMSYQL